MDGATALMHRAAKTLKHKPIILKSVATLVGRLIDHQLLKGVAAQMTELELTNICCLITDLLTSEPVCIDLNLDTPLFIVGDIFGQFGHLLRIFDYFGHPPDKRYLFLGNYVDQGDRSIETIALLYAYKLLYPNSIYLLRGKHECSSVTRMYGFYDECIHRYSRRLWYDFVSTFAYLPAAAFIEGQVFCVHSGLSPMLDFSRIHDKNSFRDQMKQQIVRPTEIHTTPLLSHLIWSMPDSNTKSWDQNPAGLGYLYGPSVVSEFCVKMDILQVIRSSELVTTGYEFFDNPQLLTIFTAPDLVGVYGNDAALVCLSKQFKDAEIRCRMKILKPIFKMRMKPTVRMNIIIEDHPVELGGITEGVVTVNEKPAVEA